MAQAAFDALVAPSLQELTFVTGWPAVLTPLAATLADQPTIADSYELYIAGREIATGYRFWPAGRQHCGVGSSGGRERPGGQPGERTQQGLWRQLHCHGWGGGMSCPCC